jgi:hypothetical protein
MSMDFGYVGNVNSTTNASSYVTTTVTPTGNCLMLAFVHNTKASTPDIPLVSGCKLPWVRRGTLLFNTVAAGLDRITVFSTLASGAFGITPVTGSFNNLTQTSCFIGVCLFTGTLTGNAGLDALVQIKSGAADTTVNPNISLNSAITNINNSVIAMFGNNQTTFGGTPEAGWQEITDVGTNPPSNGSTIVLSLGSTDNTVVVTSASANWGGFALEIGSKETTISKNLNGLSRISKSSLTSINGLSSIAKSAFKSINGLSRIAKSYNVSISGKARIIQTIDVSIAGTACIGITSLTSINGKASISSNANSLLNQLISHWKLDETTGTRNDSHGSNHLTENGTVRSAIGKIGNAASFASADTPYLSKLDNDSLSTGDIDFTIASWVKLTVDSSNQPVLQKGFEVYAEHYLEYNAGLDTFRVVIGDGGVSLPANNAGVLTAGNWYFVVFWYDSVGDKLYIQVNNRTFDSATFAGGNTSTPGEFRIGLGPGPIYNNGLIDSVSFWKRTLTDNERTLLYSTGNGFDYSNFQNAASTNGFVSISGISRISKSSTTQISGTSRIQKSNFASISGLSRISNSYFKAQSAISRIQKSTGRNITGVSNIRNNANKTQTGVSRIQKNIFVSESGTARIQKSSFISINGISRIQKSTLLSRSGIADIRKNSFKSINGVSNIASGGSSSFCSITGKSRIQCSRFVNKSGISRIQKNNLTSITGKCRLSKSSFTQIPGKGKIFGSLQAEATRVLLQSDDGFWYWLELINEEGVIYLSVDTTPDTPSSGSNSFVNLKGNDGNIYSISLTSSYDESNILFVTPYIMPGLSVYGYLNQIILSLASDYYGVTLLVTDDSLPTLVVSTLQYPSITGKASISKSSFCQISGQSRIQRNRTVSETGISRITKSLSRNQIGVARISKTSTVNISGKCRVQKSANASQTAVSRITKSSFVAQSGKANIVLNTQSSSKNISGICRIQKSSFVSINGKADIRANSFKSISGLCRIGFVNSKEITGKCRVQTSRSTNQSGISRIQKATLIFQTGLSRISKTGTLNVSGVCRIQKASSKSIQGISRIQKSAFISESGLSRISKSTFLVISGVSRISRVGFCTITGKSRISKNPLVQINGKSDIRKSLFVSNNGTGRIGIGRLTNISGLSKIVFGGNAFTSGVSNIINNATGGHIIYIQLGNGKVISISNTHSQGNPHGMETKSMNQSVRTNFV